MTVQFAATTRIDYIPNKRTTISSTIIVFFHRFCPSVFIYLLTSVPAIWFLELHEFERRVRHTSQPRAARIYNESAYEVETPPPVSEDLSAPVGSVLGVGYKTQSREIYPLDG